MARKAKSGPPRIVCPIEDLDNRDRLIVVGKTGRGKSTLIKALLAVLLAAGYRVLFFDWCDEYSQKGRATGEVTLGPLRDRLEWEALADNASALLGDPNLSLAIVPSHDPREAGEQFAELVDLAEMQGGFVLGADEIGMFGEHCAPALHKLAAQSRHWEVPAILASQSMIDIHARARRQCSRLVTFQQTHPPDLDAIRELTELSTPGFADAIPLLGPGEFRVWSDT